MDKEPGKELAEDATRESLIAISYRVPDTDVNTEKSKDHVEGEEVIEPHVRDGDEECRSKLISISQSPEDTALPNIPGEHDG